MLSGKESHRQDIVLFHAHGDRIYATVLGGNDLEVAHVKSIFKGDALIASAVEVAYHIASSLNQRAKSIDGTDTGWKNIVLRMLGDKEVEKRRLS